MVKSKKNTSRPTTNNDLSIKQLVEEAVADWKKSYNLEISSMKADLTEVRRAKNLFVKSMKGQNWIMINLLKLTRNRNQKLLLLSAIGQI